MKITYLIILFAVSCPIIKHNKLEKKHTIIKKYPDSLFYKKASKEFRWSDIQAIKKNTKPLYPANDFIKNQVLNCLDIKSEILAVDYYSSIINTDKLSALVLLVSTMDSQSFVLVTTSNGSDIISCIQLTENRCDLVEEYDDSEEIWCDEKEAYLTKPREIHLIYKFTKEFDYGKYSKIEKDSIISLYEITNKGNLNLIKRDSIRNNFNR